MELEYLAETPLKDLVAQDVRRATVLQHYGLDYCCSGGVTLAKAAAKKGLPLQPILNELNQLQLVALGKRVNFAAWPMVFLCDYLLHVHHAYTRDAIQVLEPTLVKVVRVHGPNHPELQEVNDIVSELFADLPDHFAEEEEILFPLVRQLQARDSNPSLPLPSPTQSLDQLLEEHTHAGDLLTRLTVATNHFAAPDGACNTYRFLYAKLQELRDDLYLHIHLENNILFPQVRFKYVQAAAAEIL